MKILLSRKARNDLESISRYTLQQFGPQQEERYLSGLYDHLGRLAANPQMGRLEAPKRSLRATLYEKHRILYFVDEGAVYVARVLHAAQQLEYERALKALQSLRR